MASRIINTKYLRWIVLAICTATILGGLVAWQMVSRPKRYIPAELSSQVNFTVYEPTNLPNDYSLEQDSISGDPQAIYFTLIHSSGTKELTITIQKAPPEFDAAALTQGNTIPTTVLENGTLYNLSVGDSSKYMLDTGDGTLLFFTSPAKIATKDIHDIANSLVALK